jgi:hypothetical protein
MAPGCGRWPFGERPSSVHPRSIYGPSTVYRSYKLLWCCRAVSGPVLARVRGEVPPGLKPLYDAGCIGVRIPCISFDTRCIRSDTWMARAVRARTESRVGKTCETRIWLTGRKSGGATLGSGAWIVKRAIREYPTGTLFALIPYGHDVPYGYDIKPKNPEKNQCKFVQTSGKEASTLKCGPTESQA